MEERVYEIEMIFITNPVNGKYQVECLSRRQQSIKLNFDNVEGIELITTKTMEIRNSFLQMGEGQNKIWNIRFTFPRNLLIKYSGKIVIEVL